MQTALRIRGDELARHLVEIRMGGGGQQAEKLLGGLKAMAATAGKKRIGQPV